MDSKLLSWADGVISTGYPELDSALGCGGYPRGRIVEIYGPESNDKTVLALRGIEECQKSGGVAAFIDSEHEFDIRHAGTFGVDTNQLIVIQPDNAEQAFDTLETLVRTSSVDLVVIDSVTALVTQVEQTRFPSRIMRRLAPLIASTGTCLVFITQHRMRVGKAFRSNETEVGYNALKFYSAVRMDMRTTAQGHARVKIVKNKVGVPFKEAVFNI